MQYGLVKLPLVPLRADSNERSEMVSQLLFGEYVKIIEVQEKWLYIENLQDGYQAWADRKMIETVSESAFSKNREMPITKICSPYASIYNPVSKQTILIPGGSILYDLQADKFKLRDESWTLIDINCVQNPHKQPLAQEVLQQFVTNTAMAYLNAPYLWGGKSVLGIDCSGLVQIVYSIIGIGLPRDSSQQVHEGKAIENLAKSLAGDLVFFGDEKAKITHVGILKSKTEVIHASAWVKLEQIDERGIISSTSSEYTHKLQAIRRMF